MPLSKVDNEQKIILFTSVSHFLFHFYEIAFPALAIPLMLSLKTDLKDVLALGFPMYLMFGLGALPWGLFADRFSNRLTLIICFFGTAAGAVMTALSSTPAGILIGTTTSSRTRPCSSLPGARLLTVCPIPPQLGQVLTVCIWPMKVL